MRKKEALREQIQRTVKSLEDPNPVNSLKGTFVSTTDVKKQIESTKKNIETIHSKPHESLWNLKLTAEGTAEHSPKQPIEAEGLQRNNKRKRE